ncbi:hypothetical protein Tco_0861016 [Tanacetum coccineum]|uniref:Uncharacterized protein n=1 Tax=Tanacetum coccineum TaxID=301880 RepID=A0ABQ5BMA3_9ASTR
MREVSSSSLLNGGFLLRTRDLGTRRGGSDGRDEEEDEEREMCERDDEREERERCDEEDDERRDLQRERGGEVDCEVELSCVGGGEERGERGEDEWRMMVERRVSRREEREERRLGEERVSGDE